MPSFRETEKRESVLDINFTPPAKAPKRSSSVTKPFQSLRGSIRKRRVANLLSRNAGRSLRQTGLYATVRQASKCEVFESPLIFKYNSTSRRIEDYQLHEKIEHEKKMVDASSKLLHAASTVEQVLEASKSLIVSHNRLLVYATELQRIKAEQLQGLTRIDTEQLQPCRGMLNLSDIRIPLLWKDVEHLRGKAASDHRSFAVFVLVKVGLEVVSSRVLLNVDNTLTDLCFDEDIFTFSPVSADFECELEVYCHRVTADTAKLGGVGGAAKDKRRLKELPVTFTANIGKRLSSIRSMGSPTSITHEGPKFDCIARATLRISDVSSSITSYTLTKLPEAKCELAVFDSFACHIIAQPECVGQVRISGPLAIKMESGWLPVWVRLTNQLMEIWSSEQEADSGPAMMTITINKNTAVTTEMEDGKTEPVLLVRSVSGGRTVRHQFQVTTADQLTTWHQALLQSHLDVEKWKQAVEMGADIRKTQADKRTSLSRRTMLTSYQPPSAASDSPMTRFLHKLNLPTE